MAIRLGADGLGVVDLGDSMSDAMSTMVDSLGEPDSDRILQAPFGDQGELGGGQMACWTATGTTCIDYLRIVRWEGVGLSVLISDWIVTPPGDDYYDRELQQAPPKLRGYTYWGGEVGPTLFTREGITIGSTVDDLNDAFGDRLVYSYDECVFDVAGFQVVVDPEGLQPSARNGCRLARVVGP